ncbi:TPA: hypothetical protein OUJ12_000039 [Citrobacter braakii]|nr:hypothetical protein [Citrobacter braakii]
MAMIKYLLVGFGRDGEIYEDTELKQRLNFFEASIGSNNSPPSSGAHRSYDVHLIPVNGELYAVGVGRTLNGSELPELIISSGVTPVPTDFIH